MDSLEHSQFHDIASAFAYSVGGAHADEAQAETLAPYNDITGFIVRQHARLPDYLRPAIQAVSIAFDLSAIPALGGQFHTLPPQRRAERIARWKTGRTSFTRDLVRYFESLATVALFSRSNGRNAPEIQFEDALAEPKVNEFQCQVVVIGSGPGGSITACLLAEAGYEVLLVEQGGYVKPGSCPAFSLKEMEHQYRHGGQTVTFGSGKVSYVEGCCVGGGSEINSGLYHRTPPEVLESWRKDYRVDGIDEQAMRPYFEAAERDLSVSLMPGGPPLPSLKLHEGAARLGWSCQEVPRWFRYEGPNDPQGQRQTMTRTYLPRFIRANGHILCRTTVNQLRQESGKWTVHATHAQRGDLRIRAEHVFLCAGAVQTPALLRRSGITHNIGNTLQLHPTIKVTAQFPEPINSPDVGVPVHQVKEFAPRLTFGCSISNRHYLALSLINHPTALQRLRNNWTRMGTYYAMTPGRGRGTIRFLPGFRQPLVRYGITKSDWSNLADGLNKLCELLFAAGAEALYPSITPALELREAGDVAKLRLSPRSANLMTIHLFSSCPMGEDEAKCAADSFGRVHGHRNLHVNDASLLCTSPTVNPQGSIMAIARRNVLHFLEAKSHA